MSRIRLPPKERRQYVTFTAPLSIVEDIDRLSIVEFNTTRSKTVELLVRRGIRTLISPEDSE